MSVRRSNIEFLRIVAMLMILAHHYFMHGIIHFSQPDAYIIWRGGIPFNKVISTLAMPGGKVGVAVFYIISGYFLYQKDRVSLKKLFSTSFFYGFITVILFILFRDGNALTIDIIKKIGKSIFLPVTGGGWAFVTGYFIMLLASQWINRHISDNQTRSTAVLLAVLYFAWCIIGEFFNAPYDYIQRALLFYSLGALIKKEQLNISKANAVLMLVIPWLLFSGFEFIGASNYIPGNVKTEVMLKLCTAAQSIVTPIIAVGMFCLFLSFDSRNNQFINTVASATFGVYLMHDSDLIRSFLWTNICKAEQQFSSQFFVIEAIITVLVLFLLLCLLDYILRQRIYQPIMDKVTKKVLNH